MCFRDARLFKRTFLGSYASISFHIAKEQRTVGGLRGEGTSRIGSLGGGLISLWQWGCRELCYPVGKHPIIRRKMGASNYKWETILDGTDQTETEHTCFFVSFCWILFLRYWHLMPLLTCRDGQRVPNG